MLISFVARDGEALTPKAMKLEALTLEISDMMI